MIPEFGRVLGEPIPAYFAMLVLGFVAAFYTAVRWAKKTGIDHQVMIDLGLVSLIAGVAGARILHVFVDGHFADYVNLCLDPSKVGWKVTPEECTVYEGVWDAAARVCRPSEGDCFAWAKFWQGGLVWYGGLLGAGAYGMYFVRKEGVPLLKTMDAAGFCIPLGVFFGRLGCWFGGCCFGHTSDHWSAVRFPAWSAASHAHWEAGLLSTPAAESLAVLPTQLFEAAACLAVAAFCMIVVHPRKRFDGQVFCVSMIAYAIARFLLEYLRADERGALLGLSTSQWIGLAIIGASIGLWVVFAQRARRHLEAPLEF